MSLNSLISQGNKCLSSRSNIPSAPVWHMGKVAVFESQSSFNLLQNTIDYLACKGRLSKPFNKDEKEFMKELFEALWWGGKYHGFDEAAKLANHYVNGNGKKLIIKPQVYKKSIIVTDTVAALKSFIKDMHSRKKKFERVKSSLPTFMSSKHSLMLKRGKRSVVKQGYMLKDGALLVEQSNARLKNADHRFHLEVTSTVSSSNTFVSRWQVNSLYDFEPFDKKFVTSIPLSKNFVLKLPDGLSHHLTKIGVAKDFEYVSRWHETWQ